MYSKTKHNKGISINQHTVRGYTFVEVLISLAIISLAFISAMNIIFTMYRANIFVSHMLAIDSEAVYIQGVLQELLRSTDPKSVDCTVDSTRDYNGDGISDSRLLNFALINGDQYQVVLLNNRNNPIFSGSTFNQVVLVKYDEGTATYEIINALSSPLETAVNQSVECSALIDVPERGYSVIGLTLEFTFNSTFSLRQVFGAKADTPVVQDYKVVVSSAVVN